MSGDLEFDSDAANAVAPSDYFESGELGVPKLGRRATLAQASVSATVLRSDAAGRPRLARGSRSVRAMRMAWIV